MSNLGFLEFQRTKGKSPLKYDLELGTTTIGTGLSHDIRIKSRNLETNSLFCVLNIKDNGVGIIENKCKFPVLYNGTKMKNTQILKNNDKFEIAGKRFCYVNHAGTPKRQRTNVPTSKRKSVMPNFKVKSTSRIPVPAKAASTRRSFSVEKQEKIMSRRSCASALPNTKQMYNWESTDSPNIQTSLATRNLSMQVRKSLFLKNKAFPPNSSRKSLILSIDGSISSEKCLVENGESSVSPRGQKRARDSSLGSYRPNKRQKQNNKFSFNLSISGTSDIFEDSDSLFKDNFDLTTTPPSLVESPYEETSRSESLNSSESDLNLSDSRGKVNRNSSIQKTLSDSILGSGLKRLKTPESSPVTRVQRTSTVRTPVDSTNLSIRSNVSTEKVTRQSTRLSEKVFEASRVQKSPKNDLARVSGVKKLLKTPKVVKSPKNDLTRVSGVKQLLKTPRTVKSPKNDLTRVSGVRELLKTPKVVKSPKNDLARVSGVKQAQKTPKVVKSPKNDLTRVSGVKQILKTPRVVKSPKNDLTRVSGVKQLLKTPRVVKSPKNDLTRVSGVKKLLKTPKVQNSPKNDLTDVRGIKKLVKTPRVQKSPKNDLTNVSGVKKLLKSPKIQKSPKNDLTDVRGVKYLLQPQKSPKNDLREIIGIKKLMQTPKVQNSPKNDLTELKGVKKLLRTPKVSKSPRNDLSDLEGINKLLKTPKVQKSPKNDLMNISGIEQIMKTPAPVKSPNKTPKNDQSSTLFTTPVVKKPRKVQKEPLNELSDLLGVSELFATPQLNATRSTRKGKPEENLDVSVIKPELFPPRRGRRNQLITSTPDLESKVPQKRSARNEKKKTVQAEANLTNPESEEPKRSMRVRKIKQPEEEEVKKTTRVTRKKNESEEVEKRPTRIKKNEEVSQEVEVAQKRPARGRGKKANDVEEKEVVDVSQKRTARRKKVETEEKIVRGGRRKKDTVVDDSGTVESDSVQIVESTNKRGRPRKVDNSVDASATNDVVEKKTRGRKRKVEVSDSAEITTEVDTSSKRGRRAKTETVQKTYNTRKRGK